MNLGQTGKDFTIQAAGIMEGYDVPILVTPVIPAPFRSIITHDAHKKCGVYSVTELLDNPRCARLKALHPECERGDVTKAVYSMNGRAIHEYFNNHCTQGVSEVDLTITLKGLNSEDVLISGATDHMLMMNDGSWELRDLKNWKTWKYMHGEFADVFWQLQMYTLMAQCMKDKDGSYLYNRISHLSAFVLFTDWNNGDFFRMRDKYPPSSILSFVFPVVKPELVLEFMTKRLHIHQAIQDLPEDQWADAPPEDIWQEVSYKVIKHGGKRAAPGGVFPVTKNLPRLDAKKAAERFRDEKGLEYDVKEFVGPRKRCDNYCAVCGFCTPYNKTLKEQKTDA